MVSIGCVVSYMHVHGRYRHLFSLSHSHPHSHHHDHVQPLYISHVFPSLPSFHDNFSAFFHVCIFTRLRSIAHHLSSLLVHIHHMLQMLHGYKVTHLLQTCLAIPLPTRMCYASQTLMLRAGPLRSLRRSLDGELRARRCRCCPLRTLR